MISDTRANAKINLYLDICGKRADGYHDIATVFQSVSLSDGVSATVGSCNPQEPVIPGLTANRAVIPGLTRDPQSLPPDFPLGSDNICVKAANLLLQHTNICADIQILLTKAIPVAAGLGGGSADAAAVLRILDTMLGLHLPIEELREIGARIGADVPFCLSGGTAFAGGIGEALRPLDSLSGIDCVIVTPQIAVSTKAVYGLYDESHRETPLSESQAESQDTGIHAKRPAPDTVYDTWADIARHKDLSTLCSHMYNALESVTIPLYPVIGEIKQRLCDLGSVGAMMSGSGPSVFGLFADRKSAETASRALVSAYKQTYQCFFT